MSQGEINYLAELVERELARGRLSLKIHPILLALFNAENVRKKSKETIITGLVGLGAFNSFLIDDHIYRSDALIDAYLIRMCLVTLPCLAMFWFVRHTESESFRNASLAITSIAVTLGASILFLVTQSQVGLYDPFAFTLVPILTNNLTPIRFKYALIATVIDLAIMTAVTVYSPLMSSDSIIMSMTILYAVATVTLISNYRLERSALTNFLNLLQKTLRQIEMKEANRHLKIIAREDPLTGLANRREFDSAFSRSWEYAVESLSSYAALMIDIDFFKSFNDMHGHLEGDECLRKVADTIKAQIRAGSDIAARLGGEEFCVLMPGATAQSATEIAERIRDAIEALAIPHGGQEGVPYVTVSIGAATAIAKFCDSKEQLIAAADKALYEAKRGGRNQNRLTQLDLAA